LLFEIANQQQQEGNGNPLRSDLFFVLLSQWLVEILQVLMMLFSLEAAVLAVLRAGKCKKGLAWRL
jgi:hypothetical protein